MITQEQLQRNLDEVQANVVAAAARAGRDPAEVRLVAVTKGQPHEVVERLYALGLRHFGENRIAEGQGKAQALGRLSDIHWHMIGPVGNADAVGLVKYFHFLHALTSGKAAARINEFSSYRGAPFPVLLEFNVSGEASKNGWLADDPATWADLLPVVREIAALPYVEVRGLMTMAPYDDDPESARPVFARLRALSDFFNAEQSDLALTELSMGMSADYMVAVEEGATLLRVGTALFRS